MVSIWFWFSVVIWKQKFRFGSSLWYGRRTRPFEAVSFYFSRRLDFVSGAIFCDVWPPCLPRPNGTSTTTWSKRQTGNGARKSIRKYSYHLWPSRNRNSIKVVKLTCSVIIKFDWKIDLIKYLVKEKQRVEYFAQR